MPHENPSNATFIREFLRSLRSDCLLYVLTGGFLAVGMWFAMESQHTMMGMLDHYLIQWLFHFGFAGPFIAFTFGVIHITIRLKGRKRLAYRAMLAPRRLGRFAAGTIFLMAGGLLFTSMFSSVKTSFPNSGGFIYDSIIANIDKDMHFGVDPFHYLYSFSKYTWMLRIVELNYSVLWFVICYYSLYFVMTSPRTDKIRVRFGFTWFGSWIIVGVAMARHWLSAGPIYYGRVTGDVARFAEQSAFLATTSEEPMSAYNFQQYLWALYDNGKFAIGSGISAFPSMHVALITVVALYAGERSRKLGILAWTYVAIIVFSSVYLGWHYAIDGYVSLVTITALYWFQRKVVPALASVRWRSSAAHRPLSNTE